MTRTPRYRLSVEFGSKKIGVNPLLLDTDAVQASAWTSFSYGSPAGIAKATSCVSPASRCDSWLWPPMVMRTSVATGPARQREGCPPDRPIGLDDELGTSVASSPEALVGIPIVGVVVEKVDEEPGIALARRLRTTSGCDPARCSRGDR